MSTAKDTGWVTPTVNLLREGGVEGACCPSCDEVWVGIRRSKELDEQDASAYLEYRMHYDGWAGWRSYNSATRCSKCKTEVEVYQRIQLKVKVAP